MPGEHAIAVLVLTFVALLLFTREKILLQTSALIVLCLLVLGFSLFPYEYLVDGKLTLFKPVNADPATTPRPIKEMAITIDSFCFQDSLIPLRQLTLSRDLNDVDIFIVSYFAVVYLNGLFKSYL